MPAAAAAAAPAPRERNALIALGGSFALLAVLVSAGAFTWLDQFSTEHLMPWLVPNNPPGSTTEGFYRPFRLHTVTWIKLLDLWTYPCSVLISALIVGAACCLLWRRVGPVIAVAPAVIWLAGNAVEVLGKGVITRPALHVPVQGDLVHVAPFDDSFPSGHMMRGVIVAWAIALAWQRLTPAVIVWVAFVGPALVLQSAHTITDVVGGALLGLFLVVAVHPLVTRAPAARAPG